MRLLRLPEEEVERKSEMEQENEEDEKPLLREAMTNASKNTSPRAGGMKLAGELQRLEDP